MDDERSNYQAETNFSNHEKDLLFRLMLQVLSRKGIGREWAKSSMPFTQLLDECSGIIQDNDMKAEIKNYLTKYPLAQDSIEIMLASYAMSATGSYDDKPLSIREIARIGWHLNRWIPTALLIDGPLGKIFKDINSPIAQILKTNYKYYPILSQIRDSFNNNEFRIFRNGIAHWSFKWDVDGGKEFVEILDWETGRIQLKLEVIEVEAFHTIVFAAAEALDKMVFQYVNPRNVVSETSAEGGLSGSI